MVLKPHQLNRTRSLLGSLLLTFATLFSSSQVHAQQLLVEVSGLTDVVLDQFVADARAQAPGLEIVVVQNVKPPGAALGDVRSGAIGLAVLPLSTLGIRAADAMVPPWTYQDPREVAKAISSEAAEVLSAELEKTGVYALQYWQSSFSYFASTKEINPFNVVKDKRVLAQQDTQGNRVIAALGGKLTPLAFAETYTALQVGNIDVAVVSAESFERGRLYEVLRDVVAEPYQPLIAVLLVNRAVWSNLSFEAQTALASAAKAFARSARDRVSAQQTRFRSFAQSRGVQLTSLAQDSIFEAQQAAFRVWADAVPDVPQLRDLYTANLQSARAPFLDAGGTAFPESQETIHFVTSRVRENSTKPQLAFGAKGEINHLNYGTAHVTLKAGRKLDSDLDDFAIIDPVVHHSDLNALQSAIGQASELLVFIHGYRNTFPQAVARAAAAKRDLGLSGPVLVFSWPSEGALLAYGADESSVDIARVNFQTFVGQLERIINLDKTIIVAHSMGSRLVMNYFDWADGRREFEQRSKVKHIVFAAADIVNDSFRLAAPKLARVAQRITIYASENDRALYLSKQVHFRSPVGRPDRANEIIVLDRMDSIDASDIDKASFFIDISLAARHSYIFDKAKGLHDFSSALGGLPLTSRGVSRVNRGGNSHYWKLIP